MLSNLTGWHFFIILFVVLLLFGAPKLPALARSLGQSMKILKTEMAPDRAEGADDDAAAAGQATPAANPAAAPTVVTPAPYVAPTSDAPTTDRAV
jgi:sec-independent protein translocase protein TatA